VVFYTLCISVFNLALGYALAEHLQSRGMSPGWLRPDFLSRLMLPRFGRGRLEPAGDPPAEAITIHAVSSESAALSDRQPANSAELSVGATTKTGSSESVVMRSE